MTRREKFLIGAFLPSLFIFAWFLWPPEKYSGVVTCVFRMVTDKPCPFCGLTRALACAVHGDFSAAFHHHKFWWLASALMITIAVISLYDALKGARYLDKAMQAAYQWKYPIFCSIILLAICRLF